MTAGVVMTGIGAMAIFVIGTIITWNAMIADFDNWEPFAVFTPGWIAAYFLSLWLHPRRPCRTCKGSGKHGGSFLRASHRACISCNGRGWHVRIGGKLFGFTGDDPRALRR